jgi:hypothetical protein
MIFEYKKENKGHSVYLNGQFIFWVYGSLKNAKKEALKHKIN